MHGLVLDDLVLETGARADFRTELGLDDDAVLITTVANFRTQKAYPDLLNAARKVLDACPSAVFAAVGQGPLQSELQALHAELGLGDRFKFLGYRQDVFRVLAGSDVFTLASLNEGFPIAVMEALASGVPLVVTAVGGVPDAITDGVEGFIVRPGHPADLAARLVQLASDTTLRESMAKAAGARAGAFDMRESANRIEEVYAESLDRRLRGRRRIAGAVASVVVANVFADDNRGGAAITAATLETIGELFPKARISMIAVTSDSTELARSHRHTARAFPDVALLPAAVSVPAGPLGGLRAVARSFAVLARPGRYAGVPDALGRLADADLVVSKGGFVFVERGALRGTLSLWLTAFPLMVAVRRRVPSVVLASTVGPFQSRSSRWLAGQILRRVTLVLPRDPRSAREAIALGCDPDRVVEVPDIVFRHPDVSAEDATAVADQLGFTRRYAILTVRAVSASERRQHLLAELADLARGLVTGGVVDEVAVVVQVHGPHASDLRESEQVVTMAGSEHVRLVADDLPPRELVAFYHGATVVVGCRLHSAIFAVVAGTPAVAISIDGTKTEGIFESLGLADLVVPVEQASAERLLELASSLADAGNSARQRTAAGVVQARARWSIALIEVAERAVR